MWKDWTACGCLYDLRLQCANHFAFKQETWVMSGSTIVNGIGAILIAFLMAGLLQVLNVDFGPDINGALCGVSGAGFFMWLQNRQPSTK